MYEVDRAYSAAASEFGELLAKNGHALVWGGSDRGLMKTIADAVKRSGGRIIGITAEHLKGAARKEADELVVAANIAERKRLLQERADAFVLLPGGIGSFDEITDMLELKKHGFHNKPIVILNTRGFYDGFRAQLERMEREGFIARPLREYIVFASSPKEIFRTLSSP